jgi:hypothetical protein
MNPVILTKDEAVVTLQPSGNVAQNALASSKSFLDYDHSSREKLLRENGTQRTDLEQYTKQLLNNIAAEQTQAEELPKNTNADFSSTVVPTESCKAAVETLTRSSAKVSYDISKDGKVAAVLTLLRSKYRLGDTIMGIISINGIGSTAKIVRFGATLETVEEVQPTIATLPKGRMQKLTKLIHAEHHESVLDKGRVCFSLPVPSGASPEFVTSGVKLTWLVRLSFLTVSSTKPALDSTTEGEKGQLTTPPHLMPGPSDGFSRYHISLTALTNLAGPVAQSTTTASEVLSTLGWSAETKLETVECAVPIAILPNSTGFKVGDAEFYA